MKKASIVCGLLLAVVLGLAPYWFGMQAEPIFYNFIRQAQAATQLPIHITHYDRGWFYSTAETTVQLPPEALETLRLLAPQTLAASAQPEVVTMTHDLFHGPFPLGTFRQVSLVPVQVHIVTAMRTEAKTASSAGAVTTVIGLSGAGRSTLTVAAGQMQMAARAPATLGWHPLHGQLSFTANGQHVTGTLRTAEVAGTGPQGSITAQDILLQAEAQAEAPQRYRGHLSVQGKRLAVASQDAAQQAVAWHEWSLQHAAVIGPETSDITATAQVQTIQTPETHYGPGAGTLVMRRLHTMSVLTLVRTLLPHLASADNAALLPLGSLVKTLPLLMKQSPEVELTQASLQTSAGEVRGRVKITLDAGKSPGLMTLLRPLQAVQGEGEAAVPIGLLQQLLGPAWFEQAQQMEQQGYVVREGEHYVLIARFARGQLLVNRKPVALSLFGG